MIIYFARVNLCPGNILSHNYFSTFWIKMLGFKLFLNLQIASKHIFKHPIQQNLPRIALLLWKLT